MHEWRQCESCGAASGISASGGLGPEAGIARIAAKVRFARMMPLHSGFHTCVAQQNCAIYLTCL
jgi:hypothetical protein